LGKIIFLVSEHVVKIRLSVVRFVKDTLVIEPGGGVGEGRIKRGLVKMGIDGGVV